MAVSYDAIVIGAGHNGLTCACYLAKAGLRVLVLEQYHAIGGMTITEEITAPHFYSDIHASGYQLANFSPVPQELNLHHYGLELIKPDYVFSHAFPEGDSISVNRNLEKTMASIACYSKKDAETWRQLSQKYLAEREHIINRLFSPPSPSAVNTKNFAHDNQAFQQFRFGLQSVRSWTNQTFDSERTKCLFGSFASFVGASPDDACGAELTWLFASVLQHEGNNLVKGGMHNVSLALAQVLKEHGGEIRTQVKVEKLLGDKKAASGVRLSTGEEIKASKLIVSNVDPAQLILKIMGKEFIDQGILQQMQQYEWGDSVLVMYVALHEPVHYAAGAGAEQSAQVHLCPPSIDALAQIYVECRGGRLPQAPLIIAWNESKIDATRAPAGKQLMKFVVLSVPYHITGTHWDEAKEAYADYLIDRITQHYIPDLREKIMSRVVQSPLDMERKLSSAVHGTLGHGAFLPYQHGFMRPIPALGEYRTPVPNVYLCGSGCHPGPGISMAPGRNAFYAISKDLHL